MKREDYLPEDLLPRPANWYGGDPEPDFKECPNNPNKVWVLSSGGYILYDRKDDMITSAETRLFLGDEILPLVGVSWIVWEAKCSTYVHASGPLKAKDDLDKIVTGVDLDVIAFPRLTPIDSRNPHKRVIMSFKGLWDVRRWMDDIIHPSGETQLMMNVSFMCSLEFGDGQNT